MVRNIHWVILKKYDSWIGVDGPVDPDSTVTIHLVDAHSTFVDFSGKHIDVLWLNQALHCASLEQSLIAKDQLEYNGIEVHSHAKLFNGMQCIITKNPNTAKLIKIDMGWDGSSKFILMCAC